MRSVSKMVRFGGCGLRVVALSGAVLAGLAPVAPAGAVDLKVVGVWTAFRTETTDGITICGISSGFPDGRVLYLKWYKPDDYLTVQAFKASWQIPPQVKPMVSMTFPNSNPWTATGSSSDKVSSIVEFTVPKAVVKPFVKDFTTSASGKLEFPGGSETPWVLNMSGSAGALEAMAKCIDDMAGPTADTPLAYLRRPAPAFETQPVTPPQQPVPGGQPTAPKSTQPF